MEDRPELPTSIVGRPAFGRVSYGNLERDYWYFLRFEDEERLVQITEIHPDDGSVRLRVLYIRNVEGEQNNTGWIADEDVLVFSRADIEGDDDEPVYFYKSVD